MTVHGSVFSVVGQAVVAALGPLLPGWSVVYEPPRSEEAMVKSGAFRFVYVDPEGDSTIEPNALRGWRETCPVTVVVHRLAPRSQSTMAEVDDDVASALGVLLEWLNVSRRQPAPDGWDSLELNLGEVTRQGGYLEGIAGPGRRVSVTVVATATRC